MGYSTGPLNIPLGGGHTARASAARLDRTLLLPPHELHRLRRPPLIQIDFPLDSEYEFPLNLTTRHYEAGLTVGEFVETVVDLYEAVYNMPSSRRGRRQPPVPVQGPRVDYGIYGHDIDELRLVEAEYSPSDGIFYLVVEAF